MYLPNILAFIENNSGQWREYFAKQLVPHIAEHGMMLITTHGVCGTGCAAQWGELIRGNPGHPECIPGHECSLIEWH